MDMCKYSPIDPHQSKLWIEQLSLTHYRNFNRVHLQFADGLHFFIGANAQGKTNLLESLYVVAIGKSHRTRSYRELIQFGQAKAKVELSLRNAAQTERLEVVISTKEKKIFKNGVEQQKLSRYIGTMPVVLFAPEDLALVKGGPAVRRKFLNTGIGQTNPRYLYDLSVYNQLIKQRNHLLKQHDVSKRSQMELLAVLDEQIIPVATRIWKMRLAFVEEMNRWAREIHQQLSRQKEELKLRYRSSIPIEETNLEDAEIHELFKQEMKRVRPKEISRKVTLLGPHRDDIQLFIDAIDVHTFGSQGQQRSAVLSLKLAEIEYIYQKKGIYPILLLDDVLSELDDWRKNDLFAAIHHKVQTFITTTTLDGVQPEFVKQAMVYHIKQGTIIEQR